MRRVCQAGLQHPDIADSRQVCHSHAWALPWTVMDEDEENFSIATAKDFKAHGAPLLLLLPQEARLPLMNIACMYMEELDTDPYMWGDADSDDEDEDDEEIDEGDEEQLVAFILPLSW